MDSLPAINHNAFSYFPLTGLFSICLAFRHVRRGSPAQIVLVALASLNVAWIYLSASRGAMMVGAICLIYVLLSVRGVSLRWVMIVALPLLMLGALHSFTELQTAAGARVAKLFDSEYSLEGRTSGRSDLFVAAWEMFRQHPLGVGTGGFNQEFANLQVPDMSFAGQDRNAHSAWMKVIAENGAPGFVLFAAYVFSFAVAGLVARRIHGRLALGLLITSVLATAYTSREFQGKGLWFFAVGGAMILSGAADRAKRTYLVVDEGDEDGATVASRDSY
jgi:O-antigen ligase